MGGRPIRCQRSWHTPFHYWAFNHWSSTLSPRARSETDNHKKYPFPWVPQSKVREQGCTVQASVTTPGGPHLLSCRRLVTQSVGTHRSRGTRWPQVMAGNRKQRDTFLPSLLFCRWATSSQEPAPLWAVFQDIGTSSTPIPRRSGVKFLVFRSLALIQTR